MIKQRGLKFRVWDKKKKTWLLNCALFFDNQEDDIVIFDENDDEVKFEDCIIQQYIGIQDCDYKYIFEGDIIEWGTSFSYGKIKYISEINWNDIIHGWDCKNKYGHFTLTTGNNLKIIGNIFQDSKLLK